MRVLLVLLPLVAALAGCLGPTASGLDAYKDRTVTAVLDSGVQPVNRSGEQFYFVWISGGEHLKRIEGKGTVPEERCDAPRRVEYDASQGQLRYDAERNPIDTDDLQILVAYDYTGDRLTSDALGRDCAAQSVARSYAGRAEFRQMVRDDLTIELVGEPQNGFLTYNKGYFFPIGKKIHVNLTRVERLDGGHTFYVTGDLEIVNLGLWTTDRLVAR